MRNIDVINNESISDYGCRRILGMRNVSSYIKGTSVRDSFISSRKKNKSKKEILSKSLKIVGIGAALGMLAAGIIKKKKLSKINTEKKSGFFRKILDKIKKVFKIKPKAGTEITSSNTIDAEVIIK